MTDVAAAALAGLIGDRAAPRLARGDASLWPAAVDADRRLGWIRPFDDSARALSEATALGARLREAGGARRVLVLGMGGSSLSAGLVGSRCGAPVVVLDTVDPVRVRHEIDRLSEDTLVVVSSKSGSTLETDALRRVVEERVAEFAGGAGARMVAITDRGSWLDDHAARTPYRYTFRCDPTVGGRYSALTAFGLVPAALAGGDVRPILDDARRTADELAHGTPDNPALRLAALLADRHARRGRELAVVDDPCGMGEWIEQLVAESTGKNGAGLLPVVTPDPPEYDVVAADGPLGSQLVRWEWAVALAGRLLEVDPFDQPDVESVKSVTADLLSGSVAPAVPTMVVGADPSGPAGATDATDAAAAVAALADGVPADGYLAIQAYLDPLQDRAVRDLRRAVARRGVRATFGWGPRYLHSSGQYHKGGPPVGTFLQVTGDHEGDVPVPGRPYTCGDVLRAQATADGALLVALGRPVLRLHLRDRRVDLRRLIDATIGSDGRPAAR